MTRRIPRWAISLADLTMLMLGFFVLLQAAGGNMMVQAARAAFRGAASGAAQKVRFEADALFAGDEAMLRAPARTRLHRIGAQAAAAHRRLLVSSRGIDGSGTRLDAWELAAARTAAVARALTEGGLAQERVDVALGQGDDGIQPRRQQLNIEYR